MQIHNLKRNTPRKIGHPVGRGSKRGKTSGRGTKGQNARAGHKKRPELRDIIKSLPKLRGRGVNSFKSFQPIASPVTLALIEKAFKSGDAVSPITLVEKGVVAMYKGKFPRIKILSGESFALKVEVSGCEVSEGAKALIEKAGGKVTVAEAKKPIKKA
jgi:large subunit ribosomal protein L15